MTGLWLVRCHNFLFLKNTPLHIVGGLFVLSTLGEWVGSNKIAYLWNKNYLHYEITVLINQLIEYLLNLI